MLSRVFIAFVFLFSSIFELYALEFKALVIKVLDGDTLHVLSDEKISGAKPKKDGSFVIRLRGIDAPEKDQPFGRESRQSLSDLIINKKVKVIVKDIDRYGRIVGYVYDSDNRNINLIQVQKGYAWAYTEYLDRPYASEFLSAESSARSMRRGLWVQSNPTPPWEWRKIKNGERVYENN